MPVANATTMKVYRDSVPSHCQVATDTYTCAVDYLDAKGKLLSTVVHDRAAIATIAARDSLEIEDVWVGSKHPADQPLTPTAKAARANAAEAAGTPLAEDTDEGRHDGDDAWDPSDHTVAEVLEYATGLDERDAVEAILANEQDGKARKTVIEGLEKILADDDDTIGAPV